VLVRLGPQVQAVLSPPPLGRSALMPGEPARARCLHRPRPVLVAPQPTAAP